MQVKATQIFHECARVDGRAVAYPLDVNGRRDKEVVAREAVFEIRKMRGGIALGTEHRNAPADLFEPVKCGE